MVLVMAAEIQMILNFLVILIFAYLLSEIKFGQYRMKNLTTTSVLTCSQSLVQI